MNKTRSGAKPVVPITLSSKQTNYSKPQMLFTPYKIQWKNVDLPSSHKKNSTFFNSMKNQLSNYRQHIQKMISKENPSPSSKFTSQNKSAGVTQSNEKNVLLDSTPISQKNINIHQSLNDSHSQNQKGKQNIPKIKITNDKSKIRSQNSQSNLKKTQQNGFTSPKIFKEQVKKDDKKQGLQKQLEIQACLIDLMKKQKQELLKEKQKSDSVIAMLQKQMFVLREMHERSREDDNIEILQQINNENEDLKQHNFVLQDKIQALSEKITLMEEAFNLKEEIINEQEEKIHQQQHEICIQRQEIGKLKIQLEKKKSQMEEMRIKWEASMINYEESLGIAKNEIKIKEEEYEKNIQRFQEQHITQMNYYIGELKQKYEQQIQQAKLQIQVLRQSNEKQIIKIHQHYQNLRGQANKDSHKHKQSQNQQNNGLQKLGVEFQTKINTLIEENYGLKNKIGQLQINLMKVQLDKKFLMDQIKNLEEREEYRQNNQNGEIAKICEELAALKIQKKQIIEEYEYRVMKLENDLEQAKTVSQNQKGDSLSGPVAQKNINKVLKEQLRENQELKDKIKELMGEIANLKQNLDEERIQNEFLKQSLQVEKVKNGVLEQNVSKCDSSFSSDEVNMEKIERLKEKQDRLNSLMEMKNKQIKMKDEFIQKVLIGKIDKGEGQGDIEFILSKIGIMGND